MDQTKIDALLAEPDAVLLREGLALQERVQQHTVPLFFFRGAADIGRFSGSGSGVLVRLQDRFFILTAGHCVDQAANMDDEKEVVANEVVVGVHDAPHRFVPKLYRRNRRYTPETPQDFGYFEVPASDAARIKAQGRVFLAEHSLDVSFPEDLVARNDWMVVSGFPDALMTGKRQESVGAGMLTYATTIAGTGDAPSSTIAPGLRGYHFIDLWVDRDKNINTTSEPMQEFSVPALSGASGGGCWSAGVRPLPDKWTPSALRLVGIHTATCALADDDHIFAREVLIGYPLRLIAADFDDLRPRMYERWPMLARFDAPREDQG